MARAASRRCAATPCAPRSWKDRWSFTVRNVRNSQAAREKMASAISPGRLGKPSEVAALCAYLLSDAADFITGADLPIDGGLTAE
jgi:NAD(P)-dependent dehydrogenase (short-subunit alcohol dehydrogenase family)